MTGLYSKHLENRKKAVFRNILLAIVIAAISLLQFKLMGVDVEY